MNLTSLGRNNALWVEGELAPPLATLAMPVCPADKGGAGGIQC